jgi:hypothetical protein
MNRIVAQRAGRSDRPSIDRSVNNSYIDRVVNKPNPQTAVARALPVAGVLVPIYLVVVGLTLVALLVLSLVAPSLATTNGWVHTIVVAVFAIVLPLRLRRAQTGRRGAVRAVGLIAAALFLVNVVEAVIPGFVPVWMVVGMIVVALLMAGVVLDCIRWAVVNKN